MKTDQFVSTTAAKILTKNMLFDDIDSIDLERLLHDEASQQQDAPVLYLWPKPWDPEKKRGPNPKQLYLWNERWGHKHYQTIDVLLGAARSGKTSAVTARCIYTAITYPGARIIVGSMDYEHLKNTIIGENFKELLSIKDDFDHPVLKKGRKLSREHRDLEFKNGSIIRFVNLTKFIKTLGMKADVFVIEEAPTLKEEEMFNTILSRMASMAVPWKHVMLTGNPLESLGWLVPRFKLHQFDPSYDGPPLPIGSPCECQYCQACLRHKRGRIETVNIIKVSGGKEISEPVCPECKHKNDVKGCPGNQNAQRVIQFFQTDNEGNVPDTLDANMRSAMSDDAYKRYSAGQIIIQKEGVCYPDFSNKNLLSSNRDIDPTKDLIWALDFNNNPQCSVICQEYEGVHPVTGESMTEVLVIDEIAEWNCSIKKVAHIFVTRYKHLRNDVKVRIYGDPAGYQGKIEDENEEFCEYNKYEILIQALEKAGFNIEEHAQRTVYPVDARILNGNYFFEDGDGYRRLKFNPKVVTLIASAEKTVWNAAGTKEDEAMDRKAKRSGKPNIVHPMTHPMCALTYYLIEEHPIYNKFEKVPFVQNVATGQVTQMTRQAGVQKFNINEQIDEEVDELIEDLDELDEEESVILRPTGLGLFRGGIFGDR